MTVLTKNLVLTIQLTAKITSLGYEYLSRATLSPRNLRKLIDGIGSFNEVLTAVQICVRELGDQKSTALLGLDGLIQGCMGEMARICKKFCVAVRRDLSRPVRPFGGNEIMGYIVWVEGVKNLFTIALNAGKYKLSQMEPEVMETPVQYFEKHFANERAALDYEVENNDMVLIAKEKRKKILDWLYPVAFDKRHIEISNRRLKGAGGWILEAPEFQEWINENTKFPLLWGYGIPGVGKTFLCSRIIESFQEKASMGNYGIAYIYFNYKEQYQQRPIHILASLIKQLSEQLQKLPIEIEDLYFKLESGKRRPTIEQLYTVLLVISESFTQTFIICDALDECGKKSRQRAFLPLFHQMVVGRNIKIFVTSRENPEDIQYSFVNSAKIKLHAHDEDIASYIEQKINESPRTKRLIDQNHGNYKDKIISELKFCAQGMFLLAHFHIEYLCQQPTLRNILTELEKLKISSTDSKESLLEPTYDRTIEVLRQQPKARVELAHKVLSWLVKAQRTLTIRELQQAISVEPNRYEISELDLPDKETILDVCAGLVVINGGIVRLAHYTVQEYLLTNSVIPNDVDFNLAITCITFLSFSDFSHGACRSGIPLDVRRRIYPFMDYAAKNLDYHLGLCNESLTRDPLFKLITNLGNLSSYLQALKAQKWYKMDLGYYNRYIKQTPLHVAATLGHCSLVQLLLEKATGDLDINARSYKLGDKSAIHCAANRGHKSVVQVLLKEIDVTDKIDGDTALHSAASGGCSAIVHLLLEEGANISDIGFDGDTALHRAASSGHEPVVRLLLDNGANVSIKANDGMTALHRAVSGGYDTIVQFLLDRGADASVMGGGRETALHQAASGGHEEIARILLDRGANILATKTYGETALHHAASGGYERMVQLLLERGADVGASAAKNGGETALHQAASEGHKSIVKLLLEGGANVSATTRYGVTALQRAAYGGHESVVRLLLDKGASISAATKYGTTALHRAALAGHESIVQLLLERGADTSAAGEDGETALHEAASAGNHLVVRLLIEYGADIRASEVRSGGETALHKAAFGGHGLAVRLLLQNGANLLATTKNGAIPLHRAASCGHGSVARLLLEKDADIQVSAAKDDGETPLHCAAMQGYELVVGLLLESGAKVLEAKNDGETALHLAAFGGYESVVELLLEYGADPLAVTQDGVTAMHMASARNHSSIVDLLVNKMLRLANYEGLYPIIST